ncbi:MAG TPA: hypothetical protein VLV83_10310 [Acidobacteriota bacterium]|nr:hypothetical protein [Acidobacteriota bacterium]
MSKYLFSSLTRISDLSSGEFQVRPIGREQWETGDYVVGKVVSEPSDLSRVELADGRVTGVARGDLVVGAFGRRYATLEAVGDWKAISGDFVMQALTGAAIFGRCTSRSPFIPSLLSLVYQGHVLVEGRKRRMSDCVRSLEPKRLTRPVILLIGTSMSAGKTASARIVTRQLIKMGHSVSAAKITGAGRYQDVLSVGDAGASHIFDFVDVGLPSTICERQHYRQALDQLLTRIENAGDDVAVIEAGASPLEPYNGAAAFERVRSRVAFTILAASDPYAVVGVMKGFKLKPDLVTGISTNTEAGIRLIEKLTALPALNLFQESSWPRLEAMLKEALG